MSFITIATFSNNIDAAPYVANLEHEGIRCFLKDEHTMNAAPIYEYAVGGIKLQVLEEDIQQAKEIMMEAGYQFDDNAELPKFWQSFDKMSEKWPIAGKWPIAFRFAMVLAVFVLILILIANATVGQ